ncbi:DUF2809 domain-containing protein [Mucilaginibacter koreensis]
MKFKFNPVYFVFTIILFITEVLIGAYLTDAIIRPYGGDYLVVILIYCFIKSFFNWPVLPVAVGTLLFAYLIEVSQYYHLIALLGLGNSDSAKLIMGYSFEWIDMLAYTLGVITIIIIEAMAGNLKKVM